MAKKAAAPALFVGRHRPVRRLLQPAAGKREAGLSAGAGCRGGANSVRKKVVRWRSGVWREMSSRACLGDFWETNAEFVRLINSKLLQLAAQKVFFNSVGQYCQILLANLA
jgi:hypothetical protein